LNWAVDSLECRLVVPELRVEPVAQSATSTTTLSPGIDHD
jgi:hypothetical protein